MQLHVLSKMKLYLGLMETSPPYLTRVFGETDGKLADLHLAYAAYLAQVQGEKAHSYELAAFYFPESIGAFLQRAEAALQVLADLVSFIRQTGTQNLHGPEGEKLTYDPTEIRILPPFQKPEKSFVIGFSDQARVEAMPKAEIPTGFYKLPGTFVTTGAPITWPKFSEELDADACLAIVIGKAGRRVQPAQAWDHVAGVTLLIDITARDINRREGLTTNNLLGKNFPSSTSLGPAMLLQPWRKELEASRRERKTRSQKVVKRKKRDGSYSEKDFPGRGYIPQAMTHGTIECVSLDASVKFYKEALGSMSSRMSLQSDHTTSNTHLRPGTSSAWRSRKRTANISRPCSATRSRLRPPPRSPMRRRNCRPGVKSSA
jgi:2-keto-4-pentenoate hydratase/2-oxohepta-3-ene-1,7-dioic acid hydratase in catechol pathway